MPASSANADARSRKATEREFPRRVSPIQIPLNFDLSLLEEHETLMDCIRYVAATCGVLKKNIARDMNLSPSQLARFLADNESTDPGHAFPLELLPAFVAVTRSTRPVEWLVLKFMQNPEIAKAHALETVNRATRALELALGFMQESR